jgi:predicted dehydrogenase
MSNLNPSTQNPSSQTQSLTNKTWRVAFVGAGAIVQHGHIPNFQRLPNIETVAICDVNEARAREVADDKGIPQVYTNHRQMFADVKPDITVIATPNIFHTPITLDALEAGSHVLCEKPLALTYADAQEMYESADEKGLTLTVGTHYRWSAPMQAMKAHVNSGFFGEIYAARTVWQRRSGIPGYGSWFTNKDLAGGGSLLDIGVHALDRALYLMDYPKPVSVSGATYDKLGSLGRGLGRWGSDIFRPGEHIRFDVDDLAWSFVRFDNGVTLLFQVAWATNLPEQFYTEIYGTDGGGVVGNKDTIELYSVMNDQPVRIETAVPPDPVGSYARLVDNFVRYLGGDPTAHIVTPEQALTSVRIVEGVLRSAQTGREVVFE